jgi:hypothetical protein
MIDMADFQQLVEEYSSLANNPRRLMKAFPADAIWTDRDEDSLEVAKTDLVDFVVSKYPEFVRMYEQSCGIRPTELEQSIMRPTDKEGD